MHVPTARTPTLLSTPLSLTFNYQQGTLAPASQQLVISSTNNSQLPFNVHVSGGTWLIQSITLTAIVTPASATGTVTFMDGPQPEDECRWRG
jgi:hypothetical protein